MCRGWIGRWRLNFTKGTAYGMLVAAKAYTCVPPAFFPPGRVVQFPPLCIRGGYPASAGCNAKARKLAMLGCAMSTHHSIDVYAVQQAPVKVQVTVVKVEAQEAGGRDGVEGCVRCLAPRQGSRHRPQSVLR